MHVFMEQLSLSCTFRMCFNMTGVVAAIYFLYLLSYFEKIAHMSVV